MSRALLTAPDAGGARWSYDQTIVVTPARDGFTIFDGLTKTSWTRQSLDAARQVVRQVLDGRPQAQWGAWQKAASGPVDDRWVIQSPDGRVTAWVEWLVHDPSWWQIDITVEGDARSHSYSWRVDGYHPAGRVKAQALAWAAHKATQEESP